MDIFLVDTKLTKVGRNSSQPKMGFSMPVSLTKRFFRTINAVRLGKVGFDRSKLTAIDSSKKLFVSETHTKSCAIDSRICFLELSMAVQKFCL